MCAVWNSGEPSRAGPERPEGPKSSSTVAGGTRRLWWIGWGWLGISARKCGRLAVPLAASSWWFNLRPGPDLSINHRFAPGIWLPPQNCNGNNKWKFWKSECVVSAGQAAKHDVKCLSFWEKEENGSSVPGQFSFYYNIIICLEES